MNSERSLRTRIGDHSRALQSLKILMAVLLALGLALIFIFLATPVNADNPSVSSFDDEGPPPWAEAEVVRQPDSEVRRRLAGFYSYQDSSQTAVSEISVSKDSEFRNRPIIRIQLACAQMKPSTAMPRRIAQTALAPHSPTNSPA